MSNNTNHFTPHSFELFVSSVLEQIAISNEQEIYFNTSLSDYFNYSDNLSFNHRKSFFDAIAPNNFLDYHGLVIFEYKYILKQNSIQRIVNSIKKHLNSFNNAYSFPRINIILITNSDVNQYDGFIGEKTNSEICYEIWNHQKIIEWINKYPIDYSNAINSKNENINLPLTDITRENFESKNKNNIKILKTYVDGNEPFALVLGAGVSIDPGAKSWDKLLGEFEKELTKKGLVDDSKKLGNTIGNSSLFTAQLCKELYNTDNDYFWAIHEGLYKNRQPYNTNFAIYQIAKIVKKCQINKHFRVMTYNFDGYLEDYLQNEGVTYNTIFDANCSLNEKVSLYHVHGFLPNVSYKTYLSERQKNLFS